MAIAKNYKVLETRIRDVFKSLFSDGDYVTVYVVRTCANKKPVIVGRALIWKGFKVCYKTFRDDRMYNMHLVPPGSKFDCKPGGFKWVYPTSGLEYYEKPIPLPDNAIRHGRFWCEFNI